MALRQRISSWLEGGSKARQKRDAKRRRRDRENAAAADQKALAAKARGDRPARAKPATATKATAKRAGASKTEGPAKSAGSPKGSSGKAAGRRTAAGDARKVGTEVAGIGVEVAKLAREMIVIPVQLWLALAEIVAKPVLEGWRRVLLPLLRLIGRAAAACLRFGERHVTPARAVAATCFVAIGALAASQWLDYRSVSVGNDAYSGTVGIVAPPPEVSSDIAGHAHSWVMLPLALVALVALALALTGRRRAALALVPVGIAAIAISLAVDAPKGLDEGEAAIAYEGATATLLEGFWMQLATGLVLIAGGLMLPLYLRPVPAGAVRTATGPSLAATVASRVRAGIKRRPRPRRKVAGGRRKGKVQGAGT